MNSPFLSPANPSPFRSVLTLPLLACTLALSLAACSSPRTPEVQTPGAQTPGTQTPAPRAGGRPTDADITTDAPLTNLVLSIVAGDNALSGATWSRATNGYGPVELNRSNGEAGANDGRTLSLGGKTYTRGYGVHAGSQLSFSIGGRCSALAADIGVDDEVGGNGSVVFQILGDGVKLYDSGTMTGATATKSIRVDVTGRSTVTLVVTDAGNGNAYDHADWAVPTLLGCAAPASTGSPAPADALTPEQFGARGDGVTDDTTALRSLFSALNSGTKAASFGANKVYRYRRTGPVQFEVMRDGATIYGNGATLKARDGEPTDNSWYTLRVAGPRITIQNLTIDANRAGRPAMSGVQNQTAWFVDGGSRSVTLRQIRGLNAPTDGLYIRDLVSPGPVSGTANTPTDIRLEGVEMMNSGRNNLSIVASRSVSVIGGKFNGAGGVPGGPWAGIDIEPNRGSDLQGNDGVLIEGAETSDNQGSGIDVAQLDNRNIVIRNHASHRNGTALFLSPSGPITVDGFQASSYGTLTKAGVIAIVPSDAPGATVKLSNLRVSNTTDSKPTFFQNYPGTVSLNGLRADNVATKTVLGTYKPTTVANVFLNGVQIK
ncbi:NPCBM/NEW2 domain-containing protein [Deinococcus koreensis]|uniref:NPCBM/NEW2 domain-containing protein n=1 Tax=Deinococcus koreensis TaxID=2054903 RepID=UPI0010572ABC|nr:NPCBM/NEW2 domain-containing protein [Deinococcus koreensis]